MPGRKWVDQAQPQTLQGAVILCYINAALGLLYLLAGSGVTLVLFAAAIGANGIANDRRWGYYLAVGASGLYVIAQMAAFFTYEKSLGGVLNLAFAVLLIVLLLNPESRHYQRIWFR